MQMMLSDLELEYRTAKKDWLDYVEADTHNLNPPGDFQTLWTTVLDTCPQIFMLDPVVGKHF
ncbi:hypothetical protein KXD40_007398 [Peronospora effusa]|nr:hypothetical protein DD238_003011 [Peronospora effusa]UIZ28857.1 hypothetical protein KXD40_007398 [Peronospora effusa]